MDQDNLICYLFLNTEKGNTIELRTHNPGAQNKAGDQFTGAKYFDDIGVSENTEYDLTNYLDLLAFDKLIYAIASINKGQDLLILKNMFNVIHENIRDAYSDCEFESYILDGEDLVDQYEEDKKIIKESFDRVEVYINKEIVSEKKLIDFNNSLENDKGKQLRILQDIFDILKDVRDINDKYYNVVETLQEDFEDINEDNGTDKELETKEAFKNFIKAESDFNEIYMYYKENSKKELEKGSKDKSINIFRSFIDYIELTLNLGIFKLKLKLKIK